MAKVYFAPFRAIKYVGAKAKTLHISLARPKPTLKKGDIAIVDKVTAFNLVNKGFGEFVNVDDISFTKIENEKAISFDMLVAEHEKLKQELFSALEIIQQYDNKESDESI